MYKTGLKFVSESIATNEKESTMLGFEKIPVRFFIWQDFDRDDEEDDFIECDETAFLEAEGVIEYERNTVFENGVSQICLTKNPFAGF